MDMPILAVNPNASVRSGMDLTGVPESREQAQSFEKHLDEKAAVKTEVPGTKSEATKAEAKVESDQDQKTDESSISEELTSMESKPPSGPVILAQAVLPIEELALEEVTRDDLSQVAFFLASHSSFSPSSVEESAGVEETEVAMLTGDESVPSLADGTNSKVLASLVGQQQGSSAASLSHDVKMQNIGGQSEKLDIEASEDAAPELGHLFGDPDMEAADNGMKAVPVQEIAESEAVRPRTIKSMVDSLWIQQSVKGEASPLAEAVTVQAGDSLNPVRVVRSFVDDLRPILDQMRASKTGGEMVVSLRPGDLGQVRVEIQVDKSEVHVSLFAEKAQAREILQSQWNDLKNQLSGVGLKLQDMSVNSMSAQSSERQRENGGHQRQPEWESRREKDQQAEFEDVTNEQRKDAA